MSTRIPETALKLPANEKKKAGLFSVSEGFDIPLLVILLLILSIGLITLFSASFVYSYYATGGKDSFSIIRKQIIFAIIGVVLMIIISTIDYHVLHRLAIPLIILAEILLVVVLLLPTNENGLRVHRWIPLPVVGQFQPSEVAKFALIVIFAHLIAHHHKDPKKMKTFFRGFLPFMIILGITCVLVIAEPHLSGTILLLGIGISMMFVGGTKIIYLALTMLLGAGAATFLIVKVGYEMDRIRVWLDPIGMYHDGTKVERDQALQTMQSLYAIGSGGLMGQGLGNSRQKHLFLPEGHNDFIFSIFCEEMGFIGALLVILLFALLIWRGISIGMRAADKFGSMLAIGLTLQIGIQVFLNIAVVTNIIPNTGISLPFFSYGGTSLIMLLAQMGVLLSISRSAKSK